MASRGTVEVKFVVQVVFGTKWVSVYIYCGLYLTWKVRGTNSLRLLHQVFAASIIISRGFSGLGYTLLRVRKTDEEDILLGPVC